MLLNIEQVKQILAPWIKGKKGIKKREIPKYIKKGRPVRYIQGKRAQWALDVKTRDGYKCKKCDSTENIHAYHIVPWRENVEKRYELDN